MRSAKQSPRIEEDGSLRWYYGNTVEVEFLINLVGIDDDGLPFKIPFGDRGYSVKVVVENLKKDVILDRIYSVDEVTIRDETTGCVDFLLTSEESSNFLRGDYSLHIDIISETTQKTVLSGDENKIIVE